jgi:hypothetical protein
MDSRRTSQRAGALMCCGGLAVTVAMLLLTHLVGSEPVIEAAQGGCSASSSGNGPRACTPTPTVTATATGSPAATPTMAATYRPYPTYTPYPSRREHASLTTI